MAENIIVILVTPKWGRSSVERDTCDVSGVQ